MNVRASRLNDIPRIDRVYRYCLPLFPRLIESFDLRDYDLIVSSSHCVAKGVFPHRALHISYVHAPMRYVWDMHDAYFGREWIASGSGRHVLLAPLSPKVGRCGFEAGGLLPGKLSKCRR
mgnify:CR=1 FL=1